MKIELCKKCLEQNQTCKRHLVYIPKGTAVDKKKVIKLLSKGESVNSVAEKFSVTPRRIWQIREDYRIAV